MQHFVAHYFWQIVTIAGSVTGLGFIGMLIFFGLGGLGIITGLLSVLANILRFFASPLGQIIGAVLLCATFYWVGDVIGARKEIARYEEIMRVEQAKAAERDDKIKQLTAEFVKQQTEQLSQENKDLNQKVADYENALKTRKDACPLSTDDVRRLRGIINR